SEAAVGVEAQRAVSRTGDSRGSKPGGVDIVVVANDAGCRDVQRLVFIGRVVVVGCHGRIVGVGDGDRDSGSRAIEVTVVHLVREAIGAVEIGIGHVNEGAILTGRERTVSRLIDNGQVERVVLGVGVVG